MKPGPANDGFQWKKLGAHLPLRMPGRAAEVPEAQRQKGYAEGHAEGYAAGSNQAIVEQQAKLTELQNVLAEVGRLRDKTIDDGLQDAGAALHTIFREVFMLELRTSGDLIGLLAEEVRQALRAETRPTIMLSRGDYVSLASIVPEEMRAHLDVDDSLPDGVLRASAGKSMLELDVVANLQQVLADAALAARSADGESQTVA